MNLALEGIIQGYKGPLLPIPSDKTIKIYREVIMRKMHIIEQRLVLGCQNEECIELEDQMQGCIYEDKFT